MQPKARFPVSLALFTGFYFMSASVSALVSGNGEFIFYIVIMAVLIGVVLLVHRRSNLSAGILWCFSFWGLLHMAGGLVPVAEGWAYDGPHAVLYSLWLVPERLKYDQVVHAYGFGITTWLCWEALRNGIRARQGIRLEPTLGVVVLCVAGGMGFGAFNEVIEFAATRALPETNVGGYVNTGWDLVSNAVGALLTGAVIYGRGRSRGG